MAILHKKSKTTQLQQKIKEANRLLKSWDIELINNHDKTEVDIILEERLAKIKAGEMQFDTWENVQKRLLKTMTSRLQRKG